MRGLNQALIARVGALTCAIPIEHVVETMRPLPVDPVADAVPYVLGLAVIRGEPTLVIDTARLLSTVRVTPSRFVIVRAGARKVALTFDEVRGVQGFGATLQGMPPLAASTTAVGAVIRAIAAVDAELVVVLEAARLVEVGA